MYSERLLVLFLWDILTSSLVGLDNPAWEFDWCWERVLDKRCLDNRKGTQQHAGADNGRLKGYTLHPSAVKINCKSFCEVDCANFSPNIFCYCKRISMEIWLGVRMHAWCVVDRLVAFLKSRNVEEKYLATIPCNIYITPCNSSSF